MTISFKQLTSEGKLWKKMIKLLQDTEKLIKKAEKNLEILEKGDSINVLEKINLFSERLKIVGERVREYKKKLFSALAKIAIMIDKVGYPEVGFRKLCYRISNFKNGWNPNGEIIITHFNDGRHDEYHISNFIDNLDLYKKYYTTSVMKF